MTEGERLLIGDLNDFVRYTSQLVDEGAGGNGILPEPEIETTESVIEITKFGLTIEDVPGEETPGSE